MNACKRRSASRFVIAALCAALVGCILHTPSRADAAPAKKRVTRPAAIATTPDDEPDLVDLTRTSEAPARPDEATKRAPVTLAASSTTPDVKPAEVAPVAPTSVDVAPAKKPPTLKTKTLEPLQVDAKITMNADALLAFVGGGVAADIGIVRVGPGTLALGAAGEYNLCATVCWLLNTVTPLEFGQHEISLWGRASYHIDITTTGSGSTLTKLDVFPFVMVGPTFASSYVKLDDGSAEYRGKDTAIAIGGGLGANLFVAGPVFIGGEARLRYAQGVYTYELVAGKDDQQRTYAEGSVAHWSMTGIDVQLAVGVRF